MPLLAACGTTKTVVLTDPEIVYQDRLVRAQVPANLLLECQVTPMPKRGDRITWFEVLELMKQKDSEQLACNGRFVIIENWMSEE